MAINHRGLSVLAVAFKEHQHVVRCRVSGDALPEPHLQPIANLSVGQCRQRLRPVRVYGVGDVVGRAQLGEQQGRIVRAEAAVAQIDHTVARR